MKKKLNNHLIGAFTVIEVMVAMIVLAIGLLGMAGMTIMVIKGTTDASRLTYATNLAADKMESLKDVIWADLGATTGTCDTSNATAVQKGCASQAILSEAGLNQQGLVFVSGTSGTTGPYPFTRKTVVCSQTSVANPASGTDCTSASANKCDSLRPLELSCNQTTCTPASTGEVGSNEKKIKILVSWRDRTGRCHKVDIASLQAN